MKNEDLKKLVHEVLEKGYLMSLAIYDDGGVWVSDVIYIYDDDLNIFWMSDPESRHSIAILQNPGVAGTITVSGQGENNLGIQFSGVAGKIDGPRYDWAKNISQKGKKKNPNRRKMFYRETHGIFSSRKKLR